MADHNKQTVHSLEEMASRLIKCLCHWMNMHQNHCVISVIILWVSLVIQVFCLKTSLYCATIKYKKKKVLHVWHIETRNYAVLYSVQSRNRKILLSVYYTLPQAKRNPWMECRCTRLYTRNSHINPWKYWFLAVNVEDKTEAYNSKELFLLFIILECNLSTVLFCEK